jgi:hypothetical protein
MTISVEALFFDRNEIINTDGDYISADIPYLVIGATDENEALAETLTQTPETYENIPRDTIEIQNRVNNEYYKVLVRYKTPAKSGGGGDLPQPSYSFDTSGGTQHITQSISTSKYPATANDYKQAIKVNEKDVEGVDITFPQLVFSETHYFRPGHVSQSFKVTLARKTGTINKYSFRGFDPGEVLFLGASGRRQGNKSSDLWEVEYKFAAAANITNKDVGNGIIITSARGWDFIWMEYESQVNTTSLLKIPKAAYVEQVYEESDFGALGI